MKSKTAIF